MQRNQQGWKSPPQFQEVTKARWALPCSGCCLWSLPAQFDLVTFRDTARSQGVTFGAKKEGPVPGKLQAAEFPQAEPGAPISHGSQGKGEVTMPALAVFDSSDSRPCSSCRFTSASPSAFPPQGQGGHFQQAWDKPKCASC